MPAMYRDIVLSSNVLDLGWLQTVIDSLAENRKVKCVPPWLGVVLGIEEAKKSLFTIGNLKQVS